MAKIPLPPRRPKDKVPKGNIPDSDIPVEKIFGEKGPPDSVNPDDMTKLPKGEQLPFKKGGMVRGGGCAMKGTGRGTMR